MGKHKHHENQDAKHAQQQMNAKVSKRAPQAPPIGTNAYNHFR